MVEIGVGNCCQIERITMSERKPAAPLFLLYERTHFWEIELRDRINNRLPLILGVVLALAGLESYLIDRLLPLQADATNISVTCLVLFSVISLLVSGYHVVRSWHGMEYALLPSAKVLEEHVEKLRDYCADPDCNDIDRCIESEITADLISLYIECSARNRELNKEKSSRLYRAFNWIICSVASGIVAYILLMLSGTD
jgi:hypothetical protein